MSKRPNKAKSIVAQPLFRSRQERPAKGKGSYRRDPSSRETGRLFTFWLPDDGNVKVCI